jgi:predicted methyltransferase
MKLDGILPFARTLMSKALTDGDIAIDATLGYGHDTVFMAELVGEAGIVYGFDIQEAAILSSQSRLKENNLINRVVLFQKGHEHISELVPSHHQNKIKAAIFNLGYLPGGNKSVVTKPDTTISAISQLLNIMAPEGIIILVVYHGYPEGAVERG